MAGGAVAAAASVRNVFVYGSLMAPEVLTSVIHRMPSYATAVVRDFHRYSIKDRIYPAVLPLAGDKVTGKILFDLTQEELQLLDDFEDVEYTKQIVKPTVLDKTPEDLNISIAVPLQAYLYVWAKPEDKTLYGDWDYEAWRTNHLPEFIARYVAGGGRVPEP